MGPNFVLWIFYFLAYFSAEINELICISSSSSCSKTDFLSIQCSSSSPVALSIQVEAIHLSKMKLRGIEPSMVPYREMSAH